MYSDKSKASREKKRQDKKPELHILQQVKSLGLIIKKNNFTKSWNLKAMQIMNNIEISKFQKKAN